MNFSTIFKPSTMLGSSLVFFINSFHQQQQHQQPHPQSYIPKLDFTDEQILRLIGANGDQQIISREYINGEHHILTRNENGEHIITRILTADPKMAVPENAIYATVTADDSNLSANVPEHVAAPQPAHALPPKLIESDIEPHSNGGTAEIVYASSANHIATSVLQYTDTSNKNPHIYTSATASTVPIADATTNVLISTPTTAAIDDAIDENKGKSHIIYTHGDKTYVETVKEEGHIYDNGKVPIYATTTADDAKPLDLIYEEGGKTVIYTTSTDPKSLELYAAAGNELNLLEGHQVIVQGQNVYVVAAQPPLEAEIAHAQRLVQMLLLEELCLVLTTTETSIFYDKTITMEYLSTRIPIHFSQSKYF